MKKRQKRRGVVCSILSSVAKGVCVMISVPVLVILLFLILSGCAESDRISPVPGLCKELPAKQKSECRP